MNSNTLLRRLNCASSTRVARTSRLLKFSIVLLALTLTGVTSPAASTAGASPAAPRATAPSDNADSTNKVEMVFRKSVFQDDSKSGKDPFFPRSSRRGPHVVASTEVVAPVINLVLKGITGPVKRRFALINNQTLSVGETASVKVINGQIKVHCLEIRDDAVIITVEGRPEQKELRLRAQ